MSLLGELQIRSADSLASARRRVLQLCEVFGCKAILASRLATIVSEFGRQANQTDSIRITIELEQREGRAGLLFHIDGGSRQLKPISLGHFFDSYVIQSHSIINAYHYLPEYPWHWFQKRIEQAKTAVCRPSKEELFADLEEKNRVLDEQGAELRTRVEELTRTRNELIQSEKMASLGRLVAGFAHEINTPIGVAIGAASALDEDVRCVQRLLDSDDEVSEEDLLACLEPMSEAARLAQTNLQRAARLVASFKRTAIDQSSEQMRRFRVDEVIEDITNSLHNKFKRTRIQIQVNCPEGLTIYSSPGELEQLLTNLMMNSLIHGFDNGNNTGHIQIKVGREDAFLVLDYRDDGQGMTPEQRERIFEPFFTTNRQSGGSGLGLFICYNLVTSRLKGTIQCDSSPGKGVHFSIRFPAMNDQQSAI